MNSQLHEQLLSARKALRRKYKTLKSDIAKSQSHLEKTYEPITQPLKQFLSTVQQPPTTQFKQELKHETKSPLSINQSTPQKFHQPTPQEPHQQTPHEFHKPTPQEFYQITPDEETFQYDSTIPQSDSEGSYFEESMQPVMNAQQQYLQQFAIPLPRAYIEDKISDTKNIFDDTFGIYFDANTEKFAIGNATVDFDGANIVINNQFRYAGTPGLYELMFKKQPLGYKNKDVDSYIDIIRRSNAQYLRYDPTRGLSTSNAPKFVNIIKPRITTLHSLAKERELEKTQKLKEHNLSLPKPRPRISSAPGTTTRSKRGSGLTMLDFNNIPIEYKYFDDFNELVERLKLLIASQCAGNTGVNNEIISIIEELREAGIIK